MPHEIETFDDGTAAFFTARQDAWHQLGTVTRDCLTAEQVMTTAKLGGWNVRTIPLTGSEITATGCQAPGLVEAGFSRLDGLPGEAGVLV